MGSLTAQNDISFEPIITNRNRNAIYFLVSPSLSSCQSDWLPVKQVSLISQQKRWIPSSSSSSSDRLHCWDPVYFSFFGSVSQNKGFFFFVFFYSQFGCDIYLFASLCKTGSAKIPKLAMNSVLWSYVWLECAVISPANFVCLNETSFWIVLVSSGIWFLLWFGFFSFRKILAYLFTMSFCIWRFSLVIHAESIPAFNNHLLFHL